MSTVVAVTAAAPLGGCSFPGPLDGTAERVTVLAAASLTDVMPQLVAGERKRHPDRTYEVSYAGSSQIVQQLNSGAQVDAVVLAGEEPLQALDDGLDLGETVIVATNTLVVALAQGNPGEIAQWSDLGRDDISLVVCAEQVPCGQAAQRVFAADGLRPTVASYEPDVRATLSKVASGEADAGVVYVTDVTDTDLPTLPVPRDVAVTTRYPAFSVEGSMAGEDFVSQLGSAESRAVLREAGFGSP